MVFTSQPKLLCFIARLFYLRFGIVDVVAKSLLVLIIYKHLFTPLIWGIIWVHGALIELNACSV
jgi:hypothetical protein